MGINMNRKGLCPEACLEASARRSAMAVPHGATCTLTRAVHATTQIDISALRLDSGKLALTFNVGLTW